jgi:hypothetical protein
VTDLATNGIASVLLKELAVGKGTLLQSFDSLKTHRRNTATLAEVVVLTLTNLGISKENVVALGQACIVPYGKLSVDSNLANSKSLDAP